MNSCPRVQGPESCGGRTADPALLERMARTKRLDLTGPVRVFEATEVVGESTSEAYDSAEAWLIRHSDSPDGHEHPLE